MRHYDDAEHINVGTGEDLSIRELAEMVRDIVHPDARARVRHDRSRTARRGSCSTSSRLHALGWRHRIALRDGIASTYEWFLEHERSGTDGDVAQQHGDDNRELNPSTAS